MKKHSVKSLFKHDGMWDLGGTLNELNAPSECPLRDVIECENWKVHKDGRSRVKRPGYEILDSGAEFTGESLKGAIQYTDPNDFERIIAITNKKVKSRGEDITYTRKYDEPSLVWSQFNKLKVVVSETIFGDTDPRILAWETVDNTKGRILSSADGETWSELFEVTGLGGGLFNGLGIEEYDDNIFVTFYNSPNAMVAKYDGSTVTEYDIHVGYEGVFDMLRWDGKLWIITFVTSGDDKWKVWYFNGTTWTGISDYDGDTNIDSQSGNLRAEIAARAARLFVFNNQLYLIASVYDTGEPDWTFQVWAFNSVSYADFTKVYDSLDDSEFYGMSAILQKGSNVYLIGSKITAAGDADGNQQRVYLSNDMETWSVESSSETLGFPFGEIVFPSGDGRMYFYCNFDGTDEMKVWYYDMTNKTFVLEETIATYTSSGDKRGGGMAILYGDLYTGKYKEIHRRDVTSVSWSDIYSFTEDLTDPVSIVVWEKRLIVSSNEANMMIEGTSVFPLGIEAPATVPTLADSGVAGEPNGTYKCVVTFYRSGNYPCESNPSPESAEVTVTTNKITISNIPVSTDPKVNARRIYMTYADGAIFFWADDIDDNTTTTYTYNLADDDLGDEVSYDRYPPPKGTIYEVWDNKLWIAGVTQWLSDQRDFPNLLFHTNTGTAEEMALTNWIPMKRRETDKIMMIKAFGDYLYSWKKKRRFRVAKVGDAAYEVSEMFDNIGTDAPWSVAVCDKLLLWKSEYGIEVSNGMECFRPLVSNYVKRTMATINADYLNNVIGGHNFAEGEYWLAIPTGSNTVADKVIAYDYLRGIFHGIYTFDKNISAISVTDYGGELMNLLGTPDGFIMVNNTGYNDNGTTISANFSTDWVDVTGEREMWNIIRRMFLKYILPTDKTITMKIYINYSSTVYATISLAGNTPASNADIRNTILKRQDLYVPCYVARFEFINNEDCGGECRVIGWDWYFKKRIWKHTAQASAT